MKLTERRISEKTNIVFKIGQFIALIGGIIIIVFTLTSFKNDFENKINNNTKDISTILELKETIIRIDERVELLYNDYIERKK